MHQAEKISGWKSQGAVLSSVSKGYYANASAFGREAAPHWCRATLLQRFKRQQPATPRSGMFGVAQNFRAEQGEAAFQELVKFTFSESDADGSGSIDKSELRATLKKLGIRLTGQTAAMRVLLQSELQLLWLLVVGDPHHLLLDQVARLPRRADVDNRGVAQVLARQPLHRDVQPGALVIGRHCVTERDSAPVQYNGIV